MFWCFQEVEKGCIGKEWVKLTDDMQRKSNPDTENESNEKQNY